MNLSSARHVTLLITVLFLFSGCGYTSQTRLPENIKSVHVKKVENKIDITKEITSRKAYQTYRPGLETDTRNALIDRIIFDGHLRIADEKSADAILEADLVSFRRDPLRYRDDDTIEEFRVHVSVSVSFKDVRSGKVIWKTQEISGSSDFFLSGKRSVTEDEAVEEALDDLARNVIEEVLEVW
jgi:hypothetical protein